MNGGVIASSPFVASVPTDWKIADGSSDYNGDGKSDVLWRNDNGTVLTWTMDGASISSAAPVASVTAGLANTGLISCKRYLFKISI